MTLRITSDWIRSRLPGWDAAITVYYLTAKAYSDYVVHRCKMLAVHCDSSLRVEWFTTIKV